MLCRLPAHVNSGLSPSPDKTLLSTIHIPAFYPLADSTTWSITRLQPAEKPTASSQTWGTDGKIMSVGTDWVQVSATKKAQASYWLDSGLLWHEDPKGQSQERLAIPTDEEITYIRLIPHSSWPGISICLSFNCQFCSSLCLLSRDERLIHRHPIPILAGCVPQWGCFL